MSAYKKGRRYGILTPENDGGYYDGIQNQQVSGYSVGIVYIENVNYPLIPGNVVNACTYDFPVRMKAVANLTNDRLFNNDPTIVNDIIDAAKSLVENDGVRAICSACGFFGNYQQQVRRAVNVPVAMSSLVQIPWIRGLIKPGQKIGILTANKKSLNEGLLKSCGITGMEEVSRVDASSGITISVHTSLACSCIANFGTEEQKQKFLRPLVDGSKIGCFGLTEPGAGSDVQGAQTVAVPDGDDYIITGNKIFTTNSGFADTFVVFALTDRTVPAAKGLTAFIVDRTMPGVQVSDNIERMGIRAASNCIVNYDNVRVSKDRILGQLNKGFKIAMGALDCGRIGIAAQSVGIAQGALNEAIKYAKERKQFGKPITAFQNTQFKIAELQTKIDAARLMTWRAALSEDAHGGARDKSAMYRCVFNSQSFRPFR